MVEDEGGFGSLGRYEFGLGSDLDFGANLCITMIRELLGFLFEFKKLTFDHLLLLSFLLSLLSG